jgi:tetratricopeptide (TPR) repeat protein
MIKKLIISIVIFFSLINPMSLSAQDISLLLRQAETYEKAFRDNDALQKYGDILKKDPLNVVALYKSSELYSIIGKRQPTKEKQKEFYMKGVALARQAIKINPNSSDANFAMAVSMGRMALISSGQDKIKAVKDIKTYSDKCIQLDPSNYKGYHVLGKWHYEVSDLNSLEKWLVKVTYGGLPQASIEDAIKNYEKSRQLNPGFLLNYLELAKAYRRRNDNQKARSLLKYMLTLPPATSDDPKIKEHGKKLLDEL